MHLLRPFVYPLRPIAYTLRPLARSYKTWRHGRGYGVHSPLAYTLLKQALRPPGKYGWYDQEKVVRAFRSRRLRHAAAVTFRLAALTQPATAHIATTANHTQWEALLKAARSDIKLVTNPAQAAMVITDGQPQAQPLAALDVNPTWGAITVFTHFNAHARKALRPLQALVLASPRHLAIAIKRRNLPKQIINARF